MSPAEIVPTTLPDASKVLTAAEEPPAERCRFAGLRGVKWRINLGILPPSSSSSSSSSSSVGDLRRVTADCRRRYAGLRRRLLIDPHIPKDGSNSPDPVMDNPLSQNPDSTWGRFFRSAELEKMVDQDLSRLYPEHGSYFQTSGCQGVLRRILLLWCLRHPEYGYRQGMHELLAPLLYVLHVDIDRLSQVRKLHEDHFIDKFDGLSYHENDLTYNFDFKRFSDSVEDEIGFPKNSMKSLGELDPEIQTIVLLSDAYGAEGELGVVLSEKFMEHDAYCMFDALMSGAHGSVAMADFFSPSPIGGHTAIPPVIEASTALYHLLSIVDSSLHSHLVELGVEPQYFALRWLRVLFGREFVLEDLLIIWDEIFAADNRRLDKGSEGDVAFKIFTSHRGAYITAIAVSMILHQRSSLLATENATSCLKRLLNFPENVDLKKLFDKAKSLKALALDSNMNISSPISSASGPFSRSKSMALTTLPGSASPKTLQSPVNDSYWEEKWRVMHKAEELKEGGSAKPIPTRKKGWTEKVSFGLSRTTSAPSPAKAGSGRKNKRSSVRRSLLEDLSKALGADEDIEKVVGNHEIEGQDDGEAVVSEERCSSRYTGSEENSSVFSGSMSPHAHEEHDSEKSSVASNPSVDENEVHPQTATEDLPLPLEASQNSEHNIDSPGKQATGVKERKLLLGKFQWIWKFGRHANAGEGTSEKGEDAPPGPINSSITVDDDHSITTETSTANETCTPLVNGKGDATDHDVMGPLRNLGQSMLEHIQVIEAVFQQERGQAENSSKNALVGKGQVTAVAALKELRKISNILSEM